MNFKPHLFMKKIIIRFCFLLCFSIMLVSCWGRVDDNMPLDKSNYKAVVMKRADFENAVGTLHPKNIIESGKIYIFENFLFITEVNDGFHVFNYQDPTNPIPVKYIKAPGATDLAIRNGVLYINQATDLITLKYNAQTTTFDFMYRNLNVFPQKVSPDGYYEDINSNEVVVNWILK